MATKKTNIEHLRDIINTWGHDEINVLDTTEALELLESIDEELVEANDEVKVLTTKVEEYENEEEENETTEVFLGLDTLHYRLEKGNLKVRLQLEHWINQVKQQNAAGILLPQ